MLKEDALIDLWPGSKDITERLGHEQLEICCCNYIKIDNPECLILPVPLSIASIKEPASLRETANEKFPFLKYTVNHVLDHADAAEDAGVAQSLFIDGFPLDTWISLDNIFSGVGKHRYTQQTSLLYIFADRDLLSLTKAHLEKGADVNVQNGNGETALH